MDFLFYGVYVLAELVFGVASLDQKYVMAIAVYSIGLANIQDLPQ